MDSDTKLWAVFWICTALVLSVVVAGAYLMTSRNYEAGADRDKFYASHCTVVRESMSQTGTTSTRDYSCKNK